MQSTSGPTGAGKPNRICKILSLDGGGAKGFYSLGVLREIEATLQRPIYEEFDLIFGTSTGSIIAALLATGYTVDEVHAFYCEYVPIIMQAKRATKKSEELHRVAKILMGDRGFDEVKTGLGVVATKWHHETPMIFKSRETQVHGRRATFLPGFGCTISDAVEASCSAYPFFNRKFVITRNGDEFELFDGGYCANNPTLYAIADATTGMGFDAADCRVVSVGCGRYPEPKQSFVSRKIKSFLPIQLLQKTLEVNTASMDQLRSILFGDVPTVRVNETFSRPELATDMFEHDLDKLNLLRQQGAESFASREEEIALLLQ